MSNVIKSNGAPTTNTFGYLGDFYEDLDTGNVYKLVDVNYPTVAKDDQWVTIYAHEGAVEYVWESVGGGSSLPVLEEFDFILDGNTEGRDTATFKFGDRPDTFTMYKISEPFDIRSFNGACYDNLDGTTTLHNGYWFADDMFSSYWDNNHGRIAMLTTTSTTFSYIDYDLNVVADSPGLYIALEAVDRLYKTSK